MSVKDIPMVTLSTVISVIFNLILVKYIVILTMNLLYQSKTYDTKKETSHTEIHNLSC